MGTSNFSDFITANKGRFQFINNWFCVQNSILYSLHSTSHGFRLDELFQTQDGLYPKIINIAQNPFFCDKAKSLFEAFYFMFNSATEILSDSDLYLDYNTYLASINLADQYIELNSKLVARLVYNPVKLLTQLTEKEREKNAILLLADYLTF